MQYSIFVALLLVASASALFKNLKKGKAAAAKSLAPAGSPKNAPEGLVTSLMPGKGRDMTWGGRPDPTPELYVDENQSSAIAGQGWLSAGWRYNKN